MAGSYVVFDSGALSAAAEGQTLARQIYREALTDGDSIVVPSVVVAESTRGTPRDAHLNRLLDGATIVACDEAIARDAGCLLQQTRSDATIDAIVVATADRWEGSTIVTADAGDIRALTAVRRVTWTIAVRS